MVSWQKGPIYQDQWRRSQEKTSWTTKRVENGSTGCPTKRKIGTQNLPLPVKRPPKTTYVVYPTTLIVVHVQSRHICKRRVKVVVKTINRLVEVSRRDNQACPSSPRPRDTHDNGPQRSESETIEIQRAQALSLISMTRKLHRYSMTG